LVAQDWIEVALLNYRVLMRERLIFLRRVLLHQVSNYEAQLQTSVTVMVNQTIHFQ